MKFTIKRVPFLRALESARRVADHKSVMPMLACVHLRAFSKLKFPGVVVTATDLNVTTQTTLLCESSTCGEIVLPAKTLRDAVFAITSDEVSVEVSDRLRVDVTASGVSKKNRKTKIRYTVGGMSAMDFPKIPAAPEDGYATVHADAFQLTADRVLATMDNDTSRMHLCGARLIRRENESVMDVVSTDGHRLSVDQLVVGGGQGGGGQGMTATVCRSGFVEIAKLAAEVEKIQLHVVGNHLHAKMLDEHDTTYVVSAKLVEGGYPPYEKVVPKRLRKNEITIERGPLVDALKRAIIIHKSEAKFSASPTSLRIQCDHADVGEFDEDIPALARDDSREVAVGLNPSYVYASVSKMTSDTITMQIDNDSLKPVTIRDGDDPFLSVIMPVRL